MGLLLKPTPWEEIETLEAIYLSAIEQEAKADKLKADSAEQVRQREERNKARYDMANKVVLPGYAQELLSFAAEDNADKAKLTAPTQALTTPTPPEMTTAATSDLHEDHPRENYVQLFLRFLLVFIFVAFMIIALAIIFPGAFVILLVAGVVCVIVKYCPTAFAASAETPLHRNPSPSSHDDQCAQYDHDNSVERSNAFENNRFM